MKRFFIISLLAALVQQALPCAWEDTHNYYLFNVTGEEGFSERTYRLMLNNWKVYLGSTDEYYYFNADEVALAAKTKGDALMASYVSQLQRYIDCADDVRREQWDYPTKEQLEQRRQTLNSVRLYAQQHLKSRLRSQHALLLMRCNMVLGRHAENVTFWHQTASMLPETVYRDMMRNIYAGALYRTGSPEIAAQIYAEQNDWESLMTICYEKRSFQAISSEYMRDPQSALLPFLLQDFVNNAQEATDADNPLAGGTQGKLFIRDIQQAEARQMMALAGKAATEGKTQYPALWQCAKAWLEFLYGDRQQALTDIQRAATMQGTPLMQRCVRVISCYVRAMQATSLESVEQYLTNELQWLCQQRDSSYYLSCAYERIMHQAVMPQCIAAGRPNDALAALSIVSDMDYETCIDTMDVEQLKDYLTYLGQSATLPLERFVKQQVKTDQTVMDNLVGTKYLRLCQWQQAIEWLQKVPLSFYEQKGYAPYAFYRSTTVEPWIKRQWLTHEQRYGDNRPPLKENARLSYAREMMQLEASLPLLRGQSRYQRCYDLAVRYAQACPEGDCWFIMHDGSGYYYDELSHETNLRQKAVDLLQEAGGTKDRRLRERVLFALAYVYLNPDRWYEEEWNSELSKYVVKPMPQAQQYAAFARLADFEQASSLPVADYVSRCDEYRQFRKFYKQ